MDLTVKLPDRAGNVIQLSVVRAGLYERRMRGKCPHTNVEIDSTLDVIMCLQCKTALNPVAWISMLAAEWARVQNLTREYRTAKAVFEAKKRTRCEHCNKITNVRPASAAEVREFKKGKTDG